MVKRKRKPNLEIVPRIENVAGRRLAKRFGILRADKRRKRVTYTNKEGKKVTFLRRTYSKRLSR